jgi:hypothetical protein
MKVQKSKAREFSNSRADYGAGEEVRTLDIQLGKLTLYRLSYSRLLIPEFSAHCHRCQRSRECVSYGFSDTDRLRVPHPRWAKNTDRSVPRIGFKRHGDTRDTVRIIHVQRQSWG